ncbi:MAG: hypothetical protein O2782_10120 [bacterium]|nr:hypothetical protein [bacterium]
MTRFEDVLFINSKQDVSRMTILGTTPPQRLVSAILRSPTPQEVMMFGSSHQPPRPPRHEPALLVGLAVLIATVLTLAYAGVSLLAGRLQQGGG